LNVCAETESYMRMPLATLRAMITGDMVSFEPKGVNSFTARPTARFVVSMNKRPAFVDHSSATWRRLIVVPWNYQVPVNKIVPDLWRKIVRTELPGIFNWAIRGLIRLWEQRHFTESQAVLDAVESFRTESDPVRSYLLERYELRAHSCVGRVLMWNRLEQERLRGQIRLPADYTSSQLRADVVRVFPGISEGRKRIGADNPTTVWVGLGEKPTPHKDTKGTE
jgi:hypothetical protein